MEINNYKRYVITGGSGAGKTTLVNALRNSIDVCIVKEPATIVIDESFRTESDLLPWIKLLEFVERVTEIGVEDFKTVPKDKNCFFDRGIPDSIAFLKLDNIDVPDWLVKASNNYRYNTIFWAPPWKEIYVNTRDRPETLEFAEELGYLLREVYNDLGYKVIEIPKDVLENRVNFLLRSV